MQDQLTGGQSSLQQQKSDIQENSANLQQSGTPTTSGNTSGVLSEAAPRGELKVTTVTTPSPATIAPASVQPGGNEVMLWLLIIPLLIAVRLLLSTRRPYVATEAVMEAPIVPIESASQPIKKTKKKSTKRKKSSKR